MAFDPESLTRSEWAAVSSALVRMGYDMRGAEDAKESATSMFSGKDVSHPDWKRAIALATGKIKAADNYDRSKATRAMRRATRAYGITHNIREAGYILPSGHFLDMSGKVHGGSGGSRAYDHRDASQWVDEEDLNRERHSSGMRRFMELGAIRIMPEGGGIDIARKPTNAQYQALRQFVDYFNGEVNIDLESPLAKASREYPAGTKTRRVISDIQGFYTSGQLSRMSDVAKWHTQESVSRHTIDLLYRPVV